MNYEERLIAQFKTSLFLKIFYKNIKHVSYLQLYKLHG
jgi:hypothetical protein